MREGLSRESSVVGWAIPTASKGAPGSDAGEFPSIIFQLTIDDDVVNARRKLIGFGVGSVVDDRDGVEDGNVRKESRLQSKPLPLQPLRVGRHHKQCN